MSRFAVLSVLCVLLQSAGVSQTLQNAGFEAPYSGSGSTIVANGWTAFRLSQYPQFLQSTGEKLEGYSSQQIMTNGSSYDAGVYRQITNCTVGIRYRLAGWICTSYDHAYSVVRYCPDGVMLKWLGVDPYGGTDPNSANIIWSWEEPMDRRWRRFMLDFVPQSSTVTVFARVKNQGSIGYDITWIDGFEFAPSSYARISNVGVRPETTSVTFTWTTDILSDSKVRYWKWQTTDTNDKNPIEVSGPSNVTEHSVTVTGLTSDKKYYYEVVSKASGVSAVQETIAGGRLFSTMSGQKYQTLREAKNNVDGTRIYASDLVVVAGTDQLTDSFFVEQNDRLAGIRVDKGTYDLHTGDVITVSGTLETVNSERRLTSPAIGVSAAGQNLFPLAHRNSTIGLQNLGVLVKVWGKVTAVDSVSKMMYIDDGSGLEDGTLAGRKGLRVTWNGMLGSVSPTVGGFAVVTGPVSCFIQGTAIPQVILRSPSDLRMY